MAWQWRFLADLTGPPGDAVAMGRFGAIEAKNTAQDTRLTSVEATNADQGTRLAGIEAKNYILDSDHRISHLVVDTDYANPFTDNQGFISGGPKTDGTWAFEKHPIIAGHKGATLHPIETHLTGWSYAFTDRDGYVAGGIRPDGTAEFFKLKATPTTSSRTRLAAVGDSLTSGWSAGSGWAAADAWPAKLQSLLPGVTVFNRGTAGATTDEVAIRIGALPLWLTVTGGSIPASGPVTVTTKQNIGWMPGGSSFTGALGGIPGTITQDAGTLTFTRTSAGAVTPVAGQSRWASDWVGHDGDTMIVFVGRNDVSYDVTGMEATVADHVVASTVRIVDHLTPHYKQVLLCGTITRTNEPSGSAGHAAVTEINERLAALYPGRFLDVRRYLIDRALADLGITPTPGDAANIAADTIPPSLMDDITHFTKATAAKLAEKQFAPFLTQKGWV